MSNLPDESSVLATLEPLRDPESGRSIVTMGQARDVKASAESIELTLALTTHSLPLKRDVHDEATTLLSKAFDGCTIKINEAIEERAAEKIGEIGLTAKSVVAVGSGKGGVGKSTIAASLAYGLARSGCKVGLVDADVYGPSIPHLLGVNGRPAIIDNKIQPMEKDGLKIMSMGFLVPAEEAVVWRGPMLHGAITQFLRDTQWGELDYLIIDMPPGTGDIALTLSQLLPLSGSVVVCTPQEVALLDAVKAIAMFNKVQIPVLGMVENMSGFVCPDCDKRYDIFGKGGAKEKAAELGVPFLGEVPINMQVRINGDSGTIGSVFDDPIAGPCVEQLTYNVARNLADKAKNDPPLPTLSVL
ncbi:P-loop NTPase [Planctomycetota bacterium]